jgi:biotin carboxyl carrier protein
MTAGEGPLAEGYNADLRRFQIDEEQLSLQALNIRVQLESDKVEAERLALDSERYGKLFEARLVSEQERENARLAYERIAVRIDRNTELLTQTMDQQADAQRRRKEFERSHPATATAESAPALRPLSEAVKVQASRLEELQIQMQNLILRSPVAGEVSQVLCQQGQAVVPGQAVVVIYEEIPKEVMAYLPESAAGTVRESTRVVLVRRSDPRRSAESYVTRVGAAIEATPQQLWRNPHVPEYGLPVAIAATPALNLTPGEVVFIRSWRPGTLQEGPAGSPRSPSITMIAPAPSKAIPSDELGTRTRAGPGVICAPGARSPSGTRQTS